MIVTGVDIANEGREYEKLHSLDQLGKSIIGNLRQPIPGCLEFTYLGSLAPGGED